MARPEIDFKRIRERHGTQHGGFEELCCQLAALENSAPSSTFMRKGPGADQGLECYRRFADGREVGWQAKYFEQFGKTQEDDVDDSLTRALAAHPALDTFILCLPIDLRDNRSGKSVSQLKRYETWCSKRIDQAKSEGRELKIELWSASLIEERLSRNNPLYSGRLRYWFDVTRLTTDWFAEKFEVQRRNLGERYTPDSHVDLTPCPRGAGQTTSPRHHGARCTKKGASHLLATHEVKFRAIQALSGRYPVAPMCQLFRVSRSGYYAWLHRPPSAREMANRQLLREIRLVHAEVNGIYGNRRIHAELLAQGIACGRHRIAGLMRRNGIRVRTRKRWRPVSGGQHLLPVAPNLLQRQFAASDINQR